MHSIICFIIIPIFFLIDVHTYRILGVFPLAYKSHNIFFQAIMKSLAKKGHQVDVISYYEMSNPPKNYRDIINLTNFSTNSNEIQLKSSFDSIQEAISFNNQFINGVKDHFGLRVCNLLSNEMMQEFLQNVTKHRSYDAVITEGLGTPCYYGLGHLLNVPIISASCSFEFITLSRQMGNPACMSFLPTAFFHMPVIPTYQITTFWNRVKNAFATIFLENLFLYLNENQSEAMKKYLSPNVPSVREIERKVSLSILNTHHSLRGIKPVTQAVIEIAGIHIEEDDSVLTTELKQWMDESKHGIIYMSFGTTTPIESLPKETIVSIFSSFAKLAPMRILIKVINPKKLPNIPDNILIMKWIQQIPVLRHPNTKLFVSHGGINSIMEAIYFAVPVIGVPIVYDQHQNINVLVDKNMSIELDYKKITEDYLDTALLKILNDPQFREAAKQASKIFRDRPMSSSEESVYWIERIIRNGPESLRSPAVNMHWWQIELLDIYAFLILCTVSLIYITTFTIKRIFKQCFVRNDKK